MPLRLSQRWVRLFLVLASVIVAITVCVASRHFWRFGDEDRFERQLAAEVKAFQRTRRPFQLPAIFDDAWNQIFVFGPYTEVAEIEKYVPALNACTIPRKIGESDGYCLLVFAVEHERVVACRLVERQILDFADMAASGQSPLPRELALFYVYEWTGHSRTWRTAKLQLG